jgi:phosphoserine aminotransferase
MWQFSTANHREAPELHIFERKSYKNVENADGLYNTVSVYAVGINTNKLHRILKQLNLRPVLYSLTQKAVILNTCIIVRIFFDKTVNNKCWSVRPYCFEIRPNCCGVRSADDEDYDNSYYYLLDVIFCYIFYVCFCLLFVYFLVHVLSV